MSRSQQDQVIDDEENETCPLCIEELDLSDRNFRPCPCGYQICQFCYNNIKTTMNGLCPACRRTYDDKNIQWKVLSPEEIQSHKDSVAQQQKKKAAAKQKEAAKREADSLSRKHLAGIRVRQKNLVYVTGMRPTSGAENLSELLRRDEYFGQYGRIVKVVVSKAKDSANPNAPVGVYVTFNSKDDAARCIAAVDGSQNYDTRLRAQYGTTKYCSAYLRGENCTNRNCMFLHEPGEESESFSRQDLSAMNVVNTQSGTTSNAPQNQPPAQQAPLAAAVNPADKSDSKDENASQTESNDGSALPSSVNWANKNALSPQTSHTANMASNTLTQVEEDAASREQSNKTPASVQSDSQQASDGEMASPQSIQRRSSGMMQILRSLAEENFLSSFDDEALKPQERDFIKRFPPMFDPQGGTKRHLAQRNEAERSLQETDTQVATRALAGMDLDEAAEGGSLQLGGEPEERFDLNLTGRHQQNAVSPPALGLMGSPTLGADGAIRARSRTGNPQQLQRQQLLLQQIKSPSPAQLGHGQANGSQYLGGQLHPSNPPSAHVRQTSRFSFANETSASTNVKPVANPKMMSQQSSMMPTGQYAQLQQPAVGGNQFFTSGVQGPPPGLKATGTPPVSGGGMFGQGHGFATAGLGYSANAAHRNTNEEMMRELLRNRGSGGGGAGSGPASDAGRHLADPSILQARMHQTGNATGQPLYGGAQGQGQVSHKPHDVTSPLSQQSIGSAQPLRAAPSIPPGLELPFTKTVGTPYIPDPNLFPKLGEVTPSNSAATATATAIGSAAVKQKPDDDVKVLLPQQQLESAPSQPANEPETPAATTAWSTTSVSASSTKEKPKQPQPQPEPAAPGPAANDVADSAKPTKKTEKKSAKTASETPEPIRSSKAAQEQSKPGPAAKKAAEKSSVVEPASERAASANDNAAKQDVDLTRNAPTTSTATSEHANAPKKAPPAPVSKQTGPPRTIRVLPTTKPDENSTQASASTAANVASAATSTATSAGASQKPETEKATTAWSAEADSAVMTNAFSATSRQRAATVKDKEISQQKKDAVESSDGASAPSAKKASSGTIASEGTAQAPILGRKKKTKKPTTTSSRHVSGTASSTPGSSRPHSPQPQETASTLPPVPPLDQSAQAEEPANETGNAPEPAKTNTIFDQEQSKIDHKALTDAAEKIQSIIRTTMDSLQRHGTLPDDGGEFFKGVMPTMARHTYAHEDLAFAPPQSPLTPEELALLESNKPVRRQGGRTVQGKANSSGQRLMITPYMRHCIRGLSEDLEDRLLELERIVYHSKPPGKYNHKPSHAATAQMTKFVEAMLKDATTLLMRSPSNQATSNARGDASESTANTGMNGHQEHPTPLYGDDALAYLDQFIRPHPPAHAQADVNGETGADGSDSKQMPSFGAAIPRTYTTGDPTYSVTGVDLSHYTSKYANSSPASLSTNFLNTNYLLTAQTAVWRHLIATDPRLPGDKSREQIEALATKAVHEFNARQAANPTSVDPVADVDMVKDAILAAGAAVMPSSTPAGTTDLNNENARPDIALPSDGTTTTGTGSVRKTKIAKPPAVGMNSLSPAGIYGGMLSEAEAEHALQAARKEAEALEKRFQGLMKKNRKLAGIT